MERREFVKSALVTAGIASGVAIGGEPDGNAQVVARQEFYQLRAYTLRTGPQLALTQGYFEWALIPALNRLEMSPVGVFKLDIGPEMPTYYVLIPSTSAEALVALDTHLGKDMEYVKAASGFRDAPASAPAFVESGEVVAVGLCGLAEGGGTEKGEADISASHLREPQREVAHVRKVQVQRGGD